MRAPNAWPREAPQARLRESSGGEVKGEIWGAAELDLGERMSESERAISRTIARTKLPLIRRKTPRLIGARTRRRSGRRR